MAKLDERARATAERMLKDFGKPMTYTQISSTYNVITGEDTQTTSTYNIYGYIDKATTGEIQSGLVNADDLIILVSAKALTVQPSANDTITADKTYQIKRNMPIWSGEQIALHRLVVNVG